MVYAQLDAANINSIETATIIIVIFFIFLLFLEICSILFNHFNLARPPGPAEPGF